MTFSDGFQQWMQGVQTSVETTLERSLPPAATVPVRLHEAMRYAVLGGGKRMRPLLVFAAGALFDAPAAALGYSAAAVEMIHAYSLVHDDMPCMDDDALRRGKATVHVQYDEATALLVAAQVTAIDQTAQSRMKRLDVVVLEIHLDETLPVVVALVHFDVVEHVTGKIEFLRDREVFHDGGDVDAIAFEQQPVPVLQGRLRQVQARGFAEMRRADQRTLEVVGPAMQRADDVGGIAAAIEHLGLTMSAHVGQQFDAVLVADQHAAFVFPGQRGEVAGVGHHEFVAGVARAAAEQLVGFLLQQRLVEINGHRQLRIRARELGEISQIGHPHPQINLHQPKRERIRKNHSSNVIETDEEEILDRTGDYTRSALSDLYAVSFRATMLPHAASGLRDRVGSTERRFEPRFEPDWLPAFQPASVSHAEFAQSRECALSCALRFGQGIVLKYGAACLLQAVRRNNYRPHG